MRRLSLMLVMLASLAAMTAQAQDDGMRFPGMDRNGDGVITRSEWRGSARSFERHDWNSDGILSGDEVRAGARRTYDAQDQPFDQDHSREFSDWTEAKFADLDHNRDGRLSRQEWHFDYETFRRIDRNRDDFVSRAEFLGVENDDDRGDPFTDLDANRDGRVTRDEWHASNDAFRWLDRNGDGSLSRMEVVGQEEPAPQQDDWFRRLDVDRNGRVTQDEWHWSRASFTQRDHNGDGVLTRDEWSRRESAQPTTQTPAYRQGYDRGLTDGRQAGREDGARRTWDLDGQRELEQADAGYRPELGDRSQYQAGYRAGFKVAYREGYGPR